jgi:hypothetical protein
VSASKTSATAAIRPSIGISQQDPVEDGDLAEVARPTGASFPGSARKRE